MINFENIVDEFWNHNSRNGIAIYNEDSLKFELGSFLKSKLPNYKIQFERNVSFFGINKPTVKHEIDITIFNEDQSEKYAIELKFPKNGQYPKQMYLFIEDIVFMEQLKSSGFTDTYVLTVVDNKNFYQGKSIGIYSYFRNPCANIKGIIYMPIGPQKGIESLEVHNTYSVKWEDCYLGKYYLIKMR